RNTRGPTERGHAPNGDTRHRDTARFLPFERAATLQVPPSATVSPRRGQRSLPTNISFADQSSGRSNLRLLRRIADSCSSTIMTDDLCLHHTAPGLHKRQSDKTSFTSWNGCHVQRDLSLSCLQQYATSSSS